MEIVGQTVVGAPTSQAAQRSPLAEQAAALLHKRCRIKVQDGRVLVGDFTCMDKQGNIILTNTYEVMQLNGRPHEKLMGQVLVPAAHRTTCEFAGASPAEAAALRDLLQQGGWSATGGGSQAAADEGQQGQPRAAQAPEPA